MFCAVSVTVRVAVFTLFLGVVLGIALATQFAPVPGS
jgi:ABC-type arginine transport system permease subunit